MRERWKRYEIWVAVAVLAIGIFALGYVVATVSAQRARAQDQAQRIELSKQCAVDKAQLATAYADSMAAQSTLIERMESRLKRVQNTTTRTASVAKKTAKKVGVKSKAPEHPKLKEWTK